MCEAAIKHTYIHVSYLLCSPPHQHAPHNSTLPPSAYNTPSVLCSHSCLLQVCQRLLCLLVYVTPVTHDVTVRRHCRVSGLLAVHVREDPLEPAALVILFPAAGSTAVEDPSSDLLFTSGHSEELDLALLSCAKEEFGSLSQGAAKDIPALQTVCEKEERMSALAQGNGRS